MIRLNLQLFGGRGSSGGGKGGGGSGGQSEQQFVELPKKGVLSDTEIRKGERTLESQAFEKNGNGVWELNTDYGGGQVLANSDFMGNTFYEARAWDRAYNFIGSMSEHRTLAQAKRAIREVTKGELRASR